MNHPADSLHDNRGTAERALLAALCQGSLPAHAREIVLQRLAQHSFSTPEHEVIFQAVSKSPAGRIKGADETARGRLMASLTRMGFPDIDIANFFGIAAPAEDEVPSLLDQL